MLLLVDIGNTSTSFGFYKGGRLSKVGYCLTSYFPSIAIQMINNRHTIPIKSILITSVFPKITSKIKKLARRRKHLKIWVVGGNLKVRISHNYNNINELGSDRLVNAYGAIRLYGPPVLLLDFGTALTCDYLSEKGRFEGGLIIPGPELALKTLSEKTALLPKISFPSKYRPFLGRDTRGGMQAGILQGYGAMTDGLVERFRARFGRKFQVIATGGLAKVIRPYTRHIDRVDPLLTLKSLARIFQDCLAP